jgi:hypothetical protein
VCIWCTKICTFYNQDFFFLLLQGYCMVDAFLLYTCTRFLDGAEINILQDNIILYSGDKVNIKPTPS